MEKNTKIEDIIEKAYKDMQSRYRDILDLSYKLTEKKSDLKDLIYLIDLRGQIIKHINYIQEEIRPLFDIVKEKADVNIEDIYRENVNIRNIKTNMADMIKAIYDIDKDVVHYIEEAQKELKDEMNKINKSKKITDKYSINSNKSGKIYDTRK
ncbi:MAG: hypothetical protein M0R46_08790 [Candidatus Muirbacterium halophilum]|nr:hypothetical protein [Candidatus Muirbacterium halophilum]MCK9476001.1 hypothetical protein [Candidatus Muirbacterium halophilum]